MYEDLHSTLAANVEKLGLRDRLACEQLNTPKDELICEFSFVIRIKKERNK